MPQRQTETFAFLLFLGIVAFAYVLQAILLWVLAVKFSKAAEAAAGRLQKLERACRQTLEGAAKALAAAEPFVRGARDLDTRLAVWRQRWTALAREAGEYVDDALRLGREQLQRLDKQIDSLAEETRAAAARVRDSVLIPLLEIHAAVAGLRGGLKKYLQRRRPSGRGASGH